MIRLLSLLANAYARLYDIIGVLVLVWYPYSWQQAQAQVAKMRLVQVC